MLLLSYYHYFLNLLIDNQIKLTPSLKLNEQNFQF